MLVLVLVGFGGSFERLLLSITSLRQPSAFLSHFFGVRLELVCFCLSCPPVYEAEKKEWSWSIFFCERGLLAEGCLPEGLPSRRQPSAGVGFLLGRGDAFAKLLELVERAFNPLDVAILWVELEEVAEELLGVGIFDGAGAGAAAAFAFSGSSFFSFGGGGRAGEEGGALSLSLSLYAFGRGGGRGG